jgi:16S rRNA (guanine966-N2)-methyltransferase
MRIVAGLAKGRRLAVPAEGTRPTSDRAREGMFNALAAGFDLDGAHVLDLYAGSGAIGLEALSRGATSSVFVESDRRAAATLRANIEAVGLPGARVEARPVATVLAAAAPRAFDLVFADPPYATDDAVLAGVLLAVVDNGWLAEDGLLVVERSSRGAEPTWPAGVTPLRHRRYGEGVLWYGRRR